MFVFLFHFWFAVKDATEDLSLRVLHIVSENGKTTPKQHTNSLSHMH